MAISKLAKSKCAQCGIKYMKRADRIRKPDFCCIGCRKEHHYKKVVLKRERKCKECGANFIPRQYQLTMGHGIYCSNKCLLPKLIEKGHTKEAGIKRLATWIANGNREIAQSIRGPLHKDFIGIKKSNGYIWIWTDDRGYMPEHRVVMEGIIGRELTTSDIVHHKNGVKDDNRPENLELMNRSSHMNEHRNDLLIGIKQYQLIKHGHIK